MASRFPLTSVAGRTALLIGLTAGTVGRKELEAAVLLDNQPRPYLKPVVVEGIRFKSITAAALHLVKAERKLKRPAYAARVKALQTRIARWCNENTVPGYYWAEDLTSDNIIKYYWA